MYLTIRSDHLIIKSRHIISIKSRYFVIILRHLYILYRHTWIGSIIDLAIQTKTISHSVNPCLETYSRVYTLQCTV